MATCKYDWPAAADRHLIGRSISRIDGPAKSSGRAKYSYDVHPDGMLYGKILRCPYPHAKITSLDISEAEKLPGVAAVRVIQPAGNEIFWAGDEVAGVAAVSEEIAEDAVRRIKVEYEQLPFFVDDSDFKAAEAASHTRPAVTEKKGDPDAAFADSQAVVSEGFYGIPVITHCCLETHGQVAEHYGPDSLRVWASTQAVSSLPSQFAQALSIPTANVEAICNYIGGGFGSKFQADRWGIEAARLSKQAGGKAVKLMLERSPEQMVAGCRPSAFARIKVAAKKDGTLTAWQSEGWGTGGIGPSGVPPLPYVLTGIPNQNKRYTTVTTNIGGARAWRAPNHPQAAALTMCALDDLAAQLKMDPVEFLTKNADFAPPTLARVYREELAKAAELAEWKKYWHPRGEQKSGGHLKRGLGVSMHTWGGNPHNSSCQMTIHPDGSVEVAMGSQDLGTGTRTVIAIVAAETLGLTPEAVTVKIGSSRYPFDGASGGSTTVGGVSSSTRRASVDARDELFAAVAPALGVPATELEAVNGAIRAKGNPSKSLGWKAACAKLGTKTVQAMGKQPGECRLATGGAGGVQIADVSVDTETGLVKMNRMVAAQDCGLVIDLKTAESQVYGALIMGISYSLFEEKIMDHATGRMLNPNMEFYKLATIGSIPELIVHMMTGEGYDERGVIGLGEPPVISPGAAISNAVANAIGARVPTLPLTPDKVLATISKA